MVSLNIQYSRFYLIAGLVLLAVWSWFLYSVASITIGAGLSAQPCGYWQPTWYDWFLAIMNQPIPVYCPGSQVVSAYIQGPYTSFSSTGFLPVSLDWLHIGVVLGLTAFLLSMIVFNAYGLIKEARNTVGYVAIRLVRKHEGKVVHDNTVKKPITKATGKDYAYTLKEIQKDAN